MTDGAAIPAPARLPWIAKASIILGIVAAIRLVPEVVVIVPRDPGRVYYLLLALDLLWAGLWIGAGVVLRSPRPPAIKFAAVDGALLLGNAIASAFYVARDFLKVPPSSPRPSNWDILVAFYCSRMLFYGIEIVFWACALLVLLKQAPGRAPLTAIVAAFLLAAAFQTILLVTLFGW
jgi:hypothetical protein